MAWSDYGDAIGTGVEAVGNMFSTFAAADNLKSNAGINYDVANMSADELFMSADSVLEEGHVSAMQVRRVALMRRGEQVATAARNGVIVGDGSAADMVSKTMSLARQDMQMLYYTARKKADSLIRQGHDKKIAAAMARDEAEKQAKKAKKGGVLGAVGSIAGAVIGGIAGGPAGAAIGSQIGGAVGSAAASS